MARIRTLAPAATGFVLAAAILGCAARPVPRRDGTFTDVADLGQAICDGIVAVDNDPAQVRTFAAMPGDRRVVYAESEAGVTTLEVTERDVAYTVLEESGKIDVDIGGPLKLLHGCEAEGQWMRIHIPVLADPDFEEVGRRLSRAKMPQSRVARGDAIFRSRSAGRQQIITEDHPQEQ